MPSYYKSSQKAKRGFCSNCGTPIYYQANGSEKIDITVGSLNNLDEITLAGHNGIESRLVNFSWKDELPKYRYDK